MKLMNQGKGRVSSIRIQAQSPKKNKLAKKAQPSGRQKSTTINFKSRFMKIIPTLLDYLKKETKKRTSRKEYQNLLFPSEKSPKKPKQFHEKQQLIKQYSPYSYHWYLSECGLFIEDQYLNILKEGSPLNSTIFGDVFGKIIAFSEGVSHQTLIFATSKSYLVAVSLQTQKLSSVIKLAGHLSQPIQSIITTRTKILVFSQTICSIIHLDTDSNQKLKLILTEQISRDGIKQPHIIELDNMIYIYWICVMGQLVAWELEKYQLKWRIAYFHQPTSKCILVVVTMRETKIFKYNLLKRTLKLIHHMLNTRNPLGSQRKFNYNNIQYFIKETNQINCDNDSTFYEKDNQIFVFIFVSYYDRLYSFKVYISSQIVKQNKRVRFKNLIYNISKASNQSICIILFQTKYQFNKNQIGWIANIFNESLKQNVKIYTVIVTIVQNLIQPTYLTNIDHVQKFQYQIKYYIKSYQQKQQKLKLKCKFYHYNPPNANSQLIFLQNNQQFIRRVIFKKWLDIYKQMRQTQNIKLLYFLILLKNYYSPFLRAPFESLYLQYSLQNFMLPSSKINKMILLQYYNIIDIPPPQHTILLKEEPQLLIPFIIHHRISNLNASTIQWMVNYWVNKDQRLVEQLIVGGAEFGWQLAVKKGWVRALQKMVGMGSQIQLPILKLYSLIVSQKQAHSKVKSNKQSVILIKSESQNHQNPLISILNVIANEQQDTTFENIKQYCFQITQYSKLAFSYITKPPIILQSIVSFYKVFLHPQFFDLLVLYQPYNTIKILYKLFLPQQKLQIINQFNVSDFIHCNRQFGQIEINQGYSVSQMILSHVSSTIMQIWGQNGRGYTIFKTKIQAQQDKQQGSNIKFPIPRKIRKKLLIQHAKLIDENIFHFKIDYLKQILFCLVGDNNKYLKKLIEFDENIKITSQEALDSHMQDLLVRIWQKIAQHQNIEQIKLIETQLELLNNNNHYFLIVIMESLPIQQYSNKIFHRFLKIKNHHIQKRIFNWLNNTLQNLPSFQKQAIKYLKQIIAIDRKQSRLLFARYFSSREKQIIGIIDNDPVLQLQYVQLIIDDHIENLLPLQQYYTNLHMKLLIQLQPQKIVDILQSTNAINQLNKQQIISYNLEQILRMCEECHKSSQSWYLQKRQILIYLYWKVGEIQKSIGSYIQLLQGYLKVIITFDQKDRINIDDQKLIQEQQQSNQDEDQEYIQQYGQNQTDNSQRKVSLFRQIMKGLTNDPGNDVCLIYQKKFSKTFEQMQNLIFKQPLKKYAYFYIALNGIYSIMNSIYKSGFRKKRFYLEIIRYQLGKFIVNIFERGFSGEFVKWLEGQKINQQEYNVDIPYTKCRTPQQVRFCSNFIISQMKYAILQGYQKINSQIIILQSWQKFNNRNLLEKIQQCIQKMNFGISCLPTCFICENELFDEKKQVQGLLFSCGHIFHNQCIEQVQQQQDYCWRCVCQNNFKTIIDFKDINLVQILSKLYKKKAQNKLGNLLKQIKLIEQKKKDSKSNQFKKKINRLALFDKKNSSLLNQCEIIDAKITILEYYASTDKFY